MFCENCGKEIPDDVKFCPECGWAVDHSNAVNKAVVTNANNSKSRLAAGILNIFIPGIGRIYLGYVGIGIAQLLLSFLFGVGYIWSFIDGILILVGKVTRDKNGNSLGQ